MRLWISDIKKSVLVELKGRRSSLRQLERLTGIGDGVPRGVPGEKDEYTRVN